MVEQELFNEISDLITNEFEIKKDGDIFFVTVFDKNKFNRLLNFYKSGKSNKFVLFVSGKNQLWLNPKPFYFP